MTVSTEQERAEFEAWASNEFGYHGADFMQSGGRYILDHLYFGYQGWQAARRAQVVPQFSKVAKQKLDYLLEAGEEITGYAIQNKDGRRGAIDCHGFVYWWNEPAPVQMPEPIETVRYWRDAYANPIGDEHFMGHGMVVKIFDDYLALLAHHGIK